MGAVASVAWPAGPAARAAAPSLARPAGGRLRDLDFAPFEDALAGFAPAREREVADRVDWASLAELGASMDAGVFSATELTLLYLARIRRRDPDLCSILELNPAALDDAKDADRRRAAGAALGPLDGVPVTVKDNIGTAGPLHTTGGAAVLLDHVAARDAAVVASLRRHGMVVLGKANLSELSGAVTRVPGFSAVGGQTISPSGRSFSTGGSSSGSAVAVAAGLCPASVGTETSGSLISPAALNGVVSLKPSRGALSTDGVIPLVRFQDVPGPVARTVADVATLFAAMGGCVADLPADALCGTTVAVLAQDILAQRPGLADPADNPALLRRIRAGLVAAGARVRDAEIASTEPVASFEEGFLRVVLGGLSHDTMGYLAEAGAPVTTLAELADYNLASPAERTPKGQLYVDSALLEPLGREAYERLALDYRDRAGHILDATFAAAGAEVLVSLSSLHSALYATAGLPAVSVPLGLRADGMPSGVTLIARRGEDARLLGFAAALERALGVTDRAAAPADALS